MASAVVKSMLQRPSNSVFLQGPRLAPLTVARYVRYRAHDAGFGHDDISAARKWHQSFKQGHLPSGATTYSRSSGPGGQHVNKTESKATTTWTVTELVSFLPELLHAKIRSSRYYSSRNDSLSIQAQTQRSRAANAEENRRKLFEELSRLYDETVPGESSPEKLHKHQAVEKAFHESRIRTKKHQSSKKLYRRKGAGGGDD